MISLFIVMLPPVSKYPKAPKDQPGCKLHSCPQCKQLSWISKRKRQLLVGSPFVENYEFWFGCYDCVEKKVKNEPEFFKGASNENIG